MPVELSSEQRDFVPWFLDSIKRSRCVRLIGYAGTGKTTVMRELDKIWPPNKAVWCCPSHEAKNILTGKLERSEAITIASALGLLPVMHDGRMMFVPKGRNRINEACAGGDVLVVVDESSMVSSDNLRHLLASSAKNILFVGDDAQLPPVGETVSPVYVDDCDWPTYRLTQIFRQAEGSNICLVARDTREQGINTSLDHGIENIDMTESDIAGFFRRYPEGVALCATHRVKEFCNHIARKVANGGNTPKSRYVRGEALFLESPIDPPHGPTNGDRVWITSDPEQSLIYPEIKVWSMDVEPIMGGPEYSINVPFDEDERKRIEAHLKKIESECRNPDITPLRRGELNREAESLVNKITLASHGFAMTIHKSQGSTFESVLLCTAGLSSFRRNGTHIKMVYTGITRASKNLVIGNDR